MGEPVEDNCTVPECSICQIDLSVALEVVAADIGSMAETVDIVVGFEL